VESHTFHRADFTIRSHGVCRLNPEMAGHVVGLVKMAEVITDGSGTPLVSIRLACTSVVRRLIGRILLY
jgi:hypothetical protein